MKKNIASISMFGLALGFSSMVQAAQLACSQNSLLQMNLFVSTYNKNIKKCATGKPGASCDAICSVMPAQLISEVQTPPVNCPTLPAVQPAPVCPPPPPPPPPTICPAQPVCPALPPPQPPQIIEKCSDLERQLIARDVEQRVLDRVRADFLVEGTARGNGYGIDPASCMDNATGKAMLRAQQAEIECSNRSTTFKNCKVVGTRPIQLPVPISEFIASPEIKVDSSQDAYCRPYAENAARDQALAACLAATGQVCQIVSGPTPASYRQDKEYSGLFNKKEVRFCRSEARALPPQGGFTCSVEVFAKVQL